MAAAEKDYQSRKDVDELASIITIDELLVDVQSSITARRDVVIISHVDHSSCPIAIGTYQFVATQRDAALNGTVLGVPGDSFSPA